MPPDGNTLKWALSYLRHNVSRPERLPTGMLQEMEQQLTELAAGNTSSWHNHVDFLQYVEDTAHPGIKLLGIGEPSPWGWWGPLPRFEEVLADGVDCSAGVTRYGSTRAAVMPRSQADRRLRF